MCTCIHTYIHTYIHDPTVAPDERWQAKAQVVLDSLGTKNDRSLSEMEFLHAFDDLLPFDKEVSWQSTAVPILDCHAAAVHADSQRSHNHGPALSPKSPSASKGGMNASFVKHHY